MLLIHQRLGQKSESEKRHSPITVLVKSESENDTHPSPSWSKTLKAALTSPELSFSTIFFFIITCTFKSMGKTLCSNIANHFEENSKIYHALDRYETSSIDEHRFCFLSDGEKSKKESYWVEG